MYFYGLAMAYNKIESESDSNCVVQGHKYYMSRLALTTAPMAETLCRVYGGYMVEIDDQVEYKSVMLSNFSKIQSVGVRDN